MSLGIGYLKNQPPNQSPLASCCHCLFPAPNPPSGSQPSALKGQPENSPG